jgi:hypothetical protein
MWYGGSNASKSGIGYATSSDGITWSNSTNNPIMSPGGTGFFDSSALGAPTVIKDGSTFKMWYYGYDGTNTAIGYAWSSDGILWTKYWANPVLTKTAGKFDSSWIGTPSVIKYNSTYYMTYEASNGSFPSSHKIGNAISLDGINWNKLNNGNEILSAGSSGKFDMNITSGQIISDSNQIKLWYAGTECLQCEGSNRTRLGYAYATSFTNGTFISQSHTLGSTETITWGKIYWSSNAPTGTSISYQIRTATSSAGLSTATWYGPTSSSDYYTTNGTTINSIHADQNWVQFKVWNVFHGFKPFISVEAIVGKRIY